MDAPCDPRLSLALPSEAATADLGSWFGHRIKVGDTMLLSGPIGAGKSHFARALIRARLGDPAAEVPSPTFTLVQTYDAPDGAIWHADLYRLSQPDEVIELGLEAAFDDAIVLVEWPDRLGTLSPANPIEIAFLASGDGRIAQIGTGSRRDMAADLRRDWHATDV